MHAEEIREYCITKKGVTESFPFDETTLVFKVMNKMFLLVALDAIPVQFNAKCEPEKAIELREQYPDFILPGYHMNKQHWNTIICADFLNEKQTKQLIDDSYSLIVNSLPKKTIAELNSLSPKN